MKKAGKKRGEGNELRRIGVVLEHVDDKLDLLVEGQKGLATRVDKLETNQEDFDLKLERFHLENRQSFKAIENNFKSVFQYLSAIDDELKEIRVEIVDLRKSLEAKADLARLNVLERRVQKLEVQLASYKKLPEA